MRRAALRMAIEVVGDGAEAEGEEEDVVEIRPQKHAKLKRSQRKRRM